jgi:hypothetical protein
MGEKERERLSPRSAGERRSMKLSPLEREEGDEKGRGGITGS